MPYIIAIEYSEAQRRQLAEQLAALEKSGRPLSAKYEAQSFADWSELFSTIIQPGLFAERESVVVEGAESLGAFSDSLAGVVEDDKADCALVLVFSTKTVRTNKDNNDLGNEEADGEKKGRGANPINKYLDNIKNLITIIKAEEQVLPWKRKDWLLDLAKREGVKLSPDAAQMLADSIESQEELRSELSKLSLYAGKRQITTSDVEALSFDEGGRTQMMLLDGLCDNKPQDVARALRFMREDSILPILSAITNRLRPAMILYCFPEKWQTQALKATDNDPVKKKYAVNKSRNALKNYGAARINRFMLQAARLSFLEKTSRAEGWPGLEMIIWELMAKV